MKQNQLDVVDYQVKTPGEKVFVVDDDENLGKSISRLLKRNGYECEFFTSPLEFLSRLREEEPSLILLDIKMSWIGGLDLIRGLRKNPRYKKIPVVIITGYPDGENRFQSYKLGANAFIEKPFENQELLEVISSLLEKKEQNWAEIEKG